jgi:hypothetical protein
MLQGMEYLFLDWMLDAGCSMLDTEIQRYKDARYKVDRSPESCSGFWILDAGYKDSIQNY